MNEFVNTWRTRVAHESEWYPGRETTQEEEVLRYIEKLEKRVADLDKFKTDEMWRRDQASVHRMGL